MVIYLMGNINEPSRNINEKNNADDNFDAITEFM